MAGINGIVFFILGVCIAGFAYFVNVKAETPGMAFFMWLGIVMSFYGLVKFFIVGKFKKETINPEEKLNKIMNKQNFKLCPRCGTKLPLRANFCYMCGARS